MSKPTVPKVKKPRKKTPILPDLKPEVEVTDAEKEKLIDLVKITPSVWDTSSEDYKNSKDVEETWKKWSRELKFDCKNTFKNLRNNFSTQRRSNTDSSRSGSEGGKKQKLFKFYDKMMFLNDVIISRQKSSKTVSSMEYKPKSTPTELEEPTDIVDCEDPELEEDNFEEETPKRKKKRSANFDLISDTVGMIIDNCPNYQHHHLLRSSLAALKLFQSH
ncbi:uncharacterized protein LOC132194689 [Neocloeon triangulifer]|uniref:uncharacterized protein LOC132194689 n=1 Tax=Neocloeon triangulifer TaxID=2078957 RepID=UPI00286EF35D|nr:uncharacterized protein LOC132194689 [Neocloeon triangulifer]